MDKLAQMKDILEKIADDFEKARGGNKAAGTRVRKAMQDIKTLAQEVRADMLDAREQEK